MNLSNTQLVHLGKEISQGKAIWALLTINEYLERGSGIRKAFAQRAAAACDWNLLQSSALKQVISGTRLEELNERQRCAVMNMFAGSGYHRFQPGESDLLKRHRQTRRSILTREGNTLTSRARPATVGRSSGIDGR